MNSIGMLLIMSGPSGAGKGTVVKGLNTERGYALSVSVTTRAMRPTEEEGREYFFRTVNEFEYMCNSGMLLEHAEFCGNRYGTPRAYVEEQISKGKTVVLEIDVNGALQVKQCFSDAVLVFLVPPTMEELTCRLASRNTENSGSIEGRLRRAKEEVALIERYDYLVVNDTVEQAVLDIDTIVKAERLKPFRNADVLLRIKGDGALC